MSKNINGYLGDELINKVKHLTKALNQAETIISSLEEENNRLSHALMTIASDHQTDTIIDSEAWNHQVCIS